MVAVGNLGKVWLAVPEDAGAEGLAHAFHSYFGATWAEVLVAADKSFAYNAANNAYLAVGNLQPVQALTLEQLMERKGIGRPPNIIVS